MPLPSGTALAHYELVQVLGSGAMGEVYRARDTRLGREVAIKILPERFAEDPERLARFEREARSLASLNHPNVAHIYGVDRAQGIHFLALELVPGETLEELLRRGALPVAETLAIARQIAEGLEAAHDAGVIHCDLKPANVRLTVDGKVKLLDFGLAKPMPAHDAGASSHDSALSTEAGRLIGTPTYMAPEQARGRPIDRRVDLWAFGCVLYECLAGRRAFTGESLSDVLAAVLEKEVDWSALPAATPPRLRELIERCLAKEPRERLRDAGDARLELERILAAPRDVRARRRTTSIAPIAAGAFVAGALLAAAAAWSLHGSSTTDPPRIRRFALHGSDLSIDSRGGLALSPDGRRLVYRAVDATEREMLVQHELDTMASGPIAGTERGCLPFFSPNGEELGFCAQGQLKVVALRGGVVRTLATIPGGYSGGTWLEDGTIVWTESLGRRLGSIPAVGGEAEFFEIAGTKAGEELSGPSALPGGRAMLLSVRSAPAFHIAVCDLAKRSLSVLGEGFLPIWAPGGYVLYQGVDGPLMAVPFDLSSLSAAGRPFPVVPDLGPRISTQISMFALARDGTLGYVPKAAFRERGAILVVDRTGKAETLIEVGRITDNPRYSRDGHRIAFRTSGPDCNVWVHDLERGVTTRITRDGDNHGNAWLSDDARVATLRIVRPPEGSVLALDPGGSGEPVELLSIPSIERAFVSSWSPDGLWALVGTMDGADHNVALGDVAAKSSRWLFHTRFIERAAVFAPDGKHVAYVTNEEGREEVFVQPFPALDARTKISVGGGRDPVWSRDGRELFFLSGRSMMVAAVVLSPVFSAGRSQPLFEADFVQSWGSSIASFDVSPDGSRFAMVRQRAGPESVEFHIVLDWLSELRALDPRNVVR